MSVRGMIWSVLGVGGLVLLGACGPTDEREVQQRAGVQAAEEDAGQFCGGIGGIPCPRFYVCEDDPSDSCDPQQGGRDCSGVCVPEVQEPLTACGNEPGYHYVLRDPVACRGVLFKCPGGAEAFFNDCGCGCRPAP
ncbi:hypothetical protein [Archangium primigenium]|uniref:hypothetical protein n=1 Tax=Melittangium TaxID=44 RepID=UPI00195E0B8E|nr:hypothetical protein [Archangium primigenium]MBM7114569.1 hypothetical protein [Archangium primigenium]